MISNKNKDNICKEIMNVKKEKKRCFHCNKKLKIIHFTCECNQLFCTKHRYKHDHNCVILHNKFIDEIKHNNPKIIPLKVIEI